MERPTCESCPFYVGEWEQEDEADDIGQCRRYPPSVVNSRVEEENEADFWARTESDWWCGEHPRFADYLASLKEPKCDVRSRGVETLGLTTRVLNCLDSKGIRTVGELALSSKARLMSIQNFGETSYNEVRRKLEELGLTIEPWRPSRSHSRPGETGPSLAPRHPEPIQPDQSTTGLG